MSNHLPECPAADPVWHPDYSAPCICDALRACEQRVWRDADRVVNEVYAAALDAAREAVAKVPPYEYEMNPCAAIAAIDALRGEAK